MRLKCQATPPKIRRALAVQATALRPCCVPEIERPRGFRTGSAFCQSRKQPFREIQPTAAGWCEFDVISRQQATHVSCFGDLIASIGFHHTVEVHRWGEYSRRILEKARESYTICIPIFVTGLPPCFRTE